MATILRGGAMQDSKDPPSETGQGRGADEKAGLLRRRRLRTKEREETTKREENWDGRLSLRWGILLLPACMILPYEWESGGYYDWESGGWTDENHYTNLWDLLEETEGLEGLLLIAPIMLGVAASISGALTGNVKRGPLLFFGGLAVVLLPLLGARSALADLGLEGTTDLAVLLLLVFLLAPPSSRARTGSFDVRRRRIGRPSSSAWAAWRCSSS